MMTVSDQFSSKFSCAQSNRRRGKALWRLLYSNSFETIEPPAGLVG